MDESTLYQRRKSTVQIAWTNFEKGDYKSEVECLNFGQIAVTFQRQVVHVRTGYVIAWEWQFSTLLEAARYASALSKAVDFDCVLSGKHPRSKQFFSQFHRWYLNDYLPLTRPAAFESES